MPSARVCTDPTCLHVQRPRGELAAADALVAEDDEIDLERRRIVGAQSAGVTVDRASIADAVFERCDLSNVSVRRRASLARVGFVECRMLGFALGEAARFEDVTFERCVLDDAIFDGASLVRVAFVECRMCGCGLRACKLEGVTFETCDLSRADFEGASAAAKSAVRVRATQLDGASLDARLVSSLVVDAAGACAVFQALGGVVSGEATRASCATPAARR